MNVSLRILILERDGFTCQYCGRKAPDVELHVDHVVPKSKGGSNHHTNLVTACKDCNLGKGAKSIVPANWGERDLSLRPPEKEPPRYYLAKPFTEPVAAARRTLTRMCVYCHDFVDEYVFCPECAISPLHGGECVGLHIAESECGETRAQRRSQERAIETACIDCAAGNAESTCHDCGSWLCSDCSLWCEDERYCSDCIEAARSSAGDPV